jgi:hypothetical protein
MSYLRAVYQKIYGSATGFAEYIWANLLAISVYISYQNVLNIIVINVKDLKQQMHTEHTNYIADFHLLHNGPVNLQTGTRSHTAHLSVVVTTSRSKHDSSKLMAQMCLDESRSRLSN